MQAFEDATRPGTVDRLEGELKALASAHPASERADTTVIAALCSKVVVSLQTRRRANKTGASAGNGMRPDHAS